MNDGGTSAPAVFVCDAATLPGHGENVSGVLQVGPGSSNVYVTARCAFLGLHHILRNHHSYGK